MEFIILISRGIAGRTHLCISDHQKGIRIVSSSYLIFHFLLSVLNLRKKYWDGKGLSENSTLLTTKHCSLNKSSQHMLQCFQNPDVLRRTSGQLQNTTPVTQMLNIIMQWLYSLRSQIKLWSKDWIIMTEVYHGFLQVIHENS